MPRLILVPRQEVGPWRGGLVSLGGVAVGIGFAVAILLAYGVALDEIWQEFVVYTFLDPDGLALVAVAATPLIMVGLAAALALRAGFWNIGVEGQGWLGAICATAVAVDDAGPPGLRLVLMALAAAVGGIIWIVPPLLMKRGLGINEIITTLLLNYVGALLVQDLVFGAWKDPASNFPTSESFEEGVERLGHLGWGNVDWGLPLAAGAVLIAAWLVGRSRLGAYLDAVGANSRVARAAGVPVAGVIAAAVLGSGAVAGLSGFVLAAGQEYRLSQSLMLGYGFSSIVIAFLARFRPVAALVVAILIAGLYVAGDSLQVFYQLPRATIDLIQGLILISVVASDFVARHRISYARKAARSTARPAPRPAAEAGA